MGSSLVRLCAALVIASLFTLTVTACTSAHRPVVIPTATTTDATPAHAPAIAPPDCGAQLVRLAPFSP